MSAFNARSASALLSPAPSAMLSTSSDLFTLASEMCACSKEVERIYDGTSSISTSRVRTKFMFDAPSHVRFDVAFVCYPLLDRVLDRAEHACTRALRGTRNEGTTAQSRSGGYRTRMRFARSRAQDERAANASRVCAACMHSRVHKMRSHHERKPCATCDDAIGAPEDASRAVACSRADPTSETRGARPLRAGLRV